MLATARPNEISKFKLKKGQVALTKDSETRDDIGIPTYIADDLMMPYWAIIALWLLQIRIF